MKHEAWHLLNGRQKLAFIIRDFLNLHGKKPCQEIAEKLGVTPKEIFISEMELDHNTMMFFSKNRLKT